MAINIAKVIHCTKYIQLLGYTWYTFVNKYTRCIPRVYLQSLLCGFSGSDFFIKHFFKLPTFRLFYLAIIKAGIDNGIHYRFYTHLKTLTLDIKCTIYFFGVNKLLYKED